MLENICKKKWFTLTHYICTCISLQVMNEDGHTSSIRDKILTITVKKGWKPNTRITFPEEGDQGPNNVPGNNNNVEGF